MEQLIEIDVKIERGATKAHIGGIRIYVDMTSTLMDFMTHQIKDYDQIIGTIKPVKVES